LALAELLELLVVHRLSVPSFLLVEAVVTYHPRGPQTLEVAVLVQRLALNTVALAESVFLDRVLVVVLGLTVLFHTHLAAAAAALVLLETALVAQAAALAALELAHQ
jgi:hypothetical protein